MRAAILLMIVLSGLAIKLYAQVDTAIRILTSQVAYDLNSPKQAIVKSSQPLAPGSVFYIEGTANSRPVFSGISGLSEQVPDWGTGSWYSRIDFSIFSKTGTYKIRVPVKGKSYLSFDFRIQDRGIGRAAIPAIVGFFQRQRADSPQELDADSSILLYGGTKKVNLTGGWCDASGDVSKYFSHLAYTNFMLPQQIPMVTWSMAATAEKIPGLLRQLEVQQDFIAETLYGADYLVRSLSEEGYFYMTVFSYFNKDPKARRVVGLLADSKTTSDYQCAFREGGGMAIAALARVSQWKTHGKFSSLAYLQAAEVAFNHLQQYSTRYADDHKDNIIDDYCALMAAAELWKATGKTMYRDQARKRAKNLSERLTVQGYFIADDADRPFWHAADAGLPVVALARYLDVETDKQFRELALASIKKALDYQLDITVAVTNPFGYPRQSFLYQGKLSHGFFIPHKNESGWWWQGENARLASLATAAIVGGRLVYPDKGSFGIKLAFASFAADQLAWILGCNPYDICMLYGFGKKNVPYMSSMYGHGTTRGGISNGITGKDGKQDGSGIDFKVSDNGNEWRWSEQWIPHTAWFLQAVTAMSE